MFDQASLQTATSAGVHNVFEDHFRCPANFADFRVEGKTGDSGFFRFGADMVCFGRLFGGETENAVSERLKDAIHCTRVESGACYLPFDIDEIIENLRWERYQFPAERNLRQPPSESIFRKTYYAVRPVLPVPVRKYIQQAALRGWDRIPFPSWPVDQTVDRLFDRLMQLSIRANGGEPVPFIWFWPDGFSSCAIVTHDVETEAGRDYCNSLMDLNDSFGIKSSFQLIPEERYRVPESLLRVMRKRGFEVNVHDLNHDGNLFQNHDEFLRRVSRINAYGKKFHAAGYRSGVLYRNLDWYNSLQYSYDMSVPNIGHLDPQPGGCCTTKPYFIGNILEIPVTATQDYSLLHILRDYSIDLWEQQMRLIREQNGLASFIIHPDYVIDRRARNVYTALLSRLAELRKDENLWVPLPRDVNYWWRHRRKMTLVRKRDQWQIEGPEKHRARIAYACLEGDRLVYKIERAPKPLKLVRAAMPCSAENSAGATPAGSAPAQ